MQGYNQENRRGSYGQRDRDSMDYRDRDSPLTYDDVGWRNHATDDDRQPYAFYLPNGFAMYVDDDGEQDKDLTEYGWTGIHKLVDRYGADQVELQYGLPDLPYITELAPVLDHVKEPTEYGQIGGMFDTRDEDEPPDWPEAWLWLNGDAWYFDSDGSPISEYEELGWRGLHRYLEEYDPGEPAYQFRLAASLETHSVVQPGCATIIRDMLKELD